MKYQIDYLESKRGECLANIELMKYSMYLGLATENDLVELKNEYRILKDIIKTLTK